MNGLYDGQHQKYALPEWATLTEVSDALEVSRNAVRSAARRAMKREEQWVKKEDGKLLIHTWTEMYKSHVIRWQAQKELKALSSEDWEMGSSAEGNWFAETKPSQEKVLAPYQYYPSLVVEGQRHWPELCQGLSAQGLNIFFNLLTGEQAASLQWQWGDLHGEYHYSSIKDAVIAALDCKLNSRPASPNLPVPVPIQLPVLPPAPAKKGTLRFWFFGRG